MTIRLMAWGNPTEVEAREATIAMFHEQHPNIRVEFLHTPDDYMVKLQTMLAGGDYPDVIFLGNGDILPFVTRGQLLPLNDLIERDGVDTSDIFPNIYNLYNVDGVQYGFPVDAPNQQLFYNKTMFEEAGVEPPPSDWDDETWTWDAFLEKAIALTDASKNRWGYQVLPGFRPWWIWVTANGGSFFNEDGTACVLNEPPAVEALQFLADLIHVHKVAPPLDVATEMGGATLFQSGITAMETWWPAIGYMRTNIGDKFVWDVAPHPAGAAGKSTSGGGTGHTISAFSQHPEEAWEFLKFVISQPAVERWTDIMGIVPPLQSVAQSEVFLKPDLPPENIQVFTEGSAYLRPDPQHPAFTQASQIAVSELQALWLGGVSAQEVCDRIVDQVNRLL
ncbi:MAG: sugar ABC transporter substrate-binding protein [Chloroflexota bacterium]